MITEGLLCILDRGRSTDDASLMEVKKGIIKGFLSLREHPMLELLLFTSGEGTLTINGRPYPIKQGGFVFLTPFHLFHIAGKGDSVIEYYSCKFNWGYLGNRENYSIPQAQEMSAFIESEPYVIVEGASYDHMLTRFERILEEHCNPGMCSSLVCAAFVQYLYRSFNALSAPERVYSPCADGGEVG